MPALYYEKKKIRVSESNSSDTRHHKFKCSFIWTIKKYIKAKSMQILWTWLEWSQIRQYNEKKMWKCPPFSEWSVCRGHNVRRPPIMNPEHPLLVVLWCARSQTKTHQVYLSSFFPKIFIVMIHYFIRSTFTYIPTWVPKRFVFTWTPYFCVSVIG